MTDIWFVESMGARGRTPALYHGEMPSAKGVEGKKRFRAAPVKIDPAHADMSFAQLTNLYGHKEPAPRKGDWMQTYTGKQFWPLDPRPDEVDIQDIAHALSMLCRYGGHAHSFYSVAEHSCHVHDAILDMGEYEIGLDALLHDAAEAYIVDVLRPVKPFLKDYKPIESAIMGAVQQRFNIHDEPDLIKVFDARILNDEAAQVFKHDLFKHWEFPQKGNPLGVKLCFWSPAEAKMQFLERFWQYIT